MNTEAVNDLHVSVTNITGQVVFEKNIGNASGNISIPVSTNNLASGVYQVNIQTDGKSVARNIVIE